MLKVLVETGVAHAWKMTKNVYCFYSFWRQHRVSTYMWNVFVHLGLLHGYHGTDWSLHCRTPIGISSRTRHDSWGKIWWVESTSYCVLCRYAFHALLFVSVYIHKSIYIYTHTNIDCSCITFTWEYAYVGSAFFFAICNSQINPVNSSSCLQDLHRCTLLALPADKTKCYRMVPTSDVCWFINPINIH